MKIHVKWLDGRSVSFEYAELDHRNNGVWAITDASGLTDNEFIVFEHGLQYIESEEDPDQKKKEVPHHDPENKTNHLSKTSNLFKTNKKEGQS